MAARLARIMMAQGQKALKEDHPNLLVHVHEDDCTLFTFMVLNLPPPYAHGEYLFQLKAPKGFPQKPPSFKFLTPNGVFEPGGKICISIGEFHANDRAGATGAYGWRAALGMIGFAREGGVNGMLIPESLGHGIRVISPCASAAARRGHAAASIAFNRENYAELSDAFDAICAAHPGLAAARGRAMRRALRALPPGAPRPDSFPAVRDALGPECWGILSADLPTHFRHGAQGPSRFPGDDERLAGVLAAVDAPGARLVLAALLALRLALVARPPSPARAKKAAVLIADRLPGLCGGDAGLAARVVDAVVAHDVDAKLHLALERFLLADDPAARDKRKPALLAALASASAGGGGGGGGKKAAAPAPAENAAAAAAAPPAAAEAEADFEDPAVAEEVRRAMEAADLAMARRLAGLAE
jgi:ubiquitin-protein ligase